MIANANKPDRAFRAASLISGAIFAGVAVSVVLRKNPNLEVQAAAYTQKALSTTKFLAYQISQALKSANQNSNKKTTAAPASVIHESTKGDSKQAKHQKSYNLQWEQL